MEHRLQETRASGVATCRFSSCGGSRHRGLVAPRHVGSSWFRDRTHGSCTGEWVPHHWATREVWDVGFCCGLLFMFLWLLMRCSVFSYIILVFCVPSSVKCLLRSFAHFATCMCFIYIYIYIYIYIHTHTHTHIYIYLWLLYIFWVPILCGMNTKFGWMH